MNDKSKNMNIKDEIARRPGGENVMNCFLCGSCTAGCPVSSQLDGYSPRRLMRLILLGRSEELLSSNEIWQCSQCHTCVAHCPQDVRFADIVRIIREIMVEENIVSTGFVNEVAALDEELRLLRIKKVDELLKDREVCR